MRPPATTRAGHTLGPWSPECRVLVLGEGCRTEAVRFDLTNLSEENMDVVYLLISFAFFALTWGFIKLCESV